MKLSVECQIDGNARLDATLTVSRGDTDYRFIRSDDGQLAAVRIVRRLANPEKAWSIHRRDEHGTIIGIEGQTDEGTYDDLLEEFKQLESMLAFSLSIRRLDWQCPTVSLIAETPEESQRVEFSNLRRTFNPQSQPQLALATELKAIVENMEVFEPLTVVQAFWREGNNEMDQMRYIPAFVNYFYVLEAMYANGQFGKREILREFENSDDLRVLAESFVKSPTMNESPHRENLLLMLKLHKKSWDVHGLLYVLVETRGEVHHYVPTKRRRYGTPFRNHEYHTVALAAGYLATTSICQQAQKLSMEAKTKRSPDE